jgi:asparaginyl-tRNA synthetase
MDHLRLFPHLRSRSKTFSCIWRIRHGLKRSIDDFFNEQQFLQINAPIITGNDCEGAGEAFKVVSSHDSSTKSFFKKPVYATVSAQLHLEFLASSLSRVYSLGPCFRAEPSDGTRHLV